jgi:hypothetical protein
MTEVAVAAEDVNMSEATAVVAEAPKVRSEGDVDMAMGDGDDHEKLLKAAKQSELKISRSASSSDANLVFFCKSRILLCRFEPSI